MKKIFILSILITPIAAHATGPAGYDGNPDNATHADSDGPYETATINAGDSTTVVSASYVKGAYNDAIAAINTLVDRVTADEEETQQRLYTTVNDEDTFMNSEIKQDVSTATATDLVSGLAVQDAIGTKQNKLYYTMGRPGTVPTYVDAEIRKSSDTLSTTDNTHLVSAGAVATTIASKRISAVTTWGDDNNPTQLTLSTASN